MPVFPTHGIPDAYLSNNVGFLNANNVFTGTNTINNLDISGNITLPSNGLIFNANYFNASSTNVFFNTINTGAQVNLSYSSNTNPNYILGATCFGDSGDNDNVIFYNPTTFNNVDMSGNLLVAGNLTLNGIFVMGSEWAGSKINGDLIIGNSIDTLTISSGTLVLPNNSIANSALQITVPLTNQANTFSSTQTFSNLNVNNNLDISGNLVMYGTNNLNASSTTATFGELISTGVFQLGGSINNPSYNTIYGVTHIGNSSDSVLIGAPLTCSSSLSCGTLTCSSSLSCGTLSCSSITDASSLSCTSISCTSETDSALFLVDKISENFQQITTGTNSYVLNYNNGGIFYIGTSYQPTSNFSIQINNIGTITSQSTIITMIYKAAYIPSTITVYSDNGSTQVVLSSSTPLYNSQIIPSIVSPNIVICRFSVFRFYSSNYCGCDIVYY